MAIATERRQFAVVDPADESVIERLESARPEDGIAAVDAATVKAYDVSFNEQRPDWTNRTSYVIAPDGKILLAHTDMPAPSHITKTLEAVKTWKAAHGAHANH